MNGGQIDWILSCIDDTLQHTATHWNALQRTATHCKYAVNTLQHTVTHRCQRIERKSVGSRAILTTHCNTLQRTATHCNTLQHTATHCNTLQHTATHCNTQVSMNGAQIDWILSICVRVHALGWTEYDPHIQVCVYMHTNTCVFLPEYDAMYINIICAYMDLSMIPTSRCVCTYIHTHTCSCLNVMLCIYILYVHTYV